MDKSGSTARPTRNKPGIRTFDAHREQIVERAPVNREDYVSTQRVRSACGPNWPVELPMLFLFDSGSFLLCDISSLPLRSRALPLQQIRRVSCSGFFTWLILSRLIFV